MSAKGIVFLNDESQNTMDILTSTLNVVCYILRYARILRQNDHKILLVAKFPFLWHKRLLVRVCMRASSMRNKTLHHKRRIYSLADSICRVFWRYSIRLARQWRIYSLNNNVKLLSQLKPLSRWICTEITEKSVRFRVWRNHYIQISYEMWLFAYAYHWYFS